MTEVIRLTESDSMINRQRAWASLGLVLAATGVFVWLVITDSVMLMEPIDQALCPADLHKAPDGTCGIYERGGINGVAIAAMVTAVLGILAYVATIYLPEEH